MYVALELRLGSVRGRLNHAAGRLCIRVERHARPFGPDLFTRKMHLHVKEGTGKSEKS
jgi:hypothetical protein